MALAPKKTYSRRENGLFDSNEREKENVDPFDVLLSSPLKQDVQFQPLGFWGKRVRDLESKKKKEVKCGLYEANDPDGLNSSWKKSKPRTLQPKFKVSKLGDKRKNHSTAHSFIKKGKQQVLPNDSATLKSAKDIIKYKGCSPKNKNEILNFFCKSCGSFKCINKHSSCGNFIKSSEKTKKNVYPVKFKYHKININNLEFRKCRGSSSAEQLKDINENLINEYKKDSVNEAVQCNETTEETLVCCNKSMEETLVHCNESSEEGLVSLSKGCNRFKYVTIRRHTNFLKYLSYDGNYDSSPGSDNFKISNISPIQARNKQNEVINPLNLNAAEDNSVQVECSGSICGSVNNANYYFNESHYPEDFVSELGSEESATVLESLGVRFSNDSDLKYFSNNKLEDTIEELLEKESVEVLAETSVASDDTFSEQDTVIKISPGSQEKNVSIADSQAENHVCLGSSPNVVSLLTTGISDLSITWVADEQINSGTEKLVNVQTSNYKDKEDNSFYVDLRNVTTKRGGFLNEKSDSRIIGERCPANLKQAQDGSEFDQTFELSFIPNRMSTDWNKSVLIGNPVFESTRIFDTGPSDVEKPRKQSDYIEKMHCILEENPSQLDHSYFPKPGKQWIRSMSLLKRIQNANLTGGVFESTRITGRKFESFVQDLLKMQNEKSNFFATITDMLPNRTSASGDTKSKFFDRLSSDGTVLKSQSSREDESEELEDSVLLKTVSSKAVSGKFLLNHTVKVVQFEDSSSTFRSALGLDSNRSIVQASFTDRHSNRQENSEISAKDFILIQCGQEDVLPFEEYFNEKTLPNCRKIGEGVYGEVFMYSDTVIKIIPIEGPDQVNGAPQKTFEEIISEVVIALQLSNLRKGDRNRTDGFSELKRCWCVSGKYPEYLLKLWNEYDQSGSGSENDSPIMFKEDQLYIILELANGGKDLESFVFSSSLQTLSVFIQTSFSLAAAENAFEFEHRDLHWGNVLISKTNDKFTSVVVDNVEYKIPTKGVKVCIIDFTLSRVNHNGCCIFNDLASDPELFTAHGDYQFEIYRMMLAELKNDWSLFNPKTNLFWLHYLVDKMIKMVRYKIRSSKLHKKHMKDLNSLESIVLSHKSSTSFVLSKSLNDVLIKL